MTDNQEKQDSGQLAPDLPFHAKIEDAVKVVYERLLRAEKDISEAHEYVRECKNEINLIKAVTESHTNKLERHERKIQDQHQLFLELKHEIGALKTSTSFIVTTLRNMNTLIGDIDSTIRNHLTDAAENNVQDAEAEKQRTKQHESMMKRLSTLVTVVTAYTSTVMVLVIGLALVSPEVREIASHFIPFLE